VCVQALDEVKLREMAIIDLHKKIADAETRFKQQQSIYEAVRADRNMYSKKVIEAQDEIQEMKRKFKIMNHQIEQLKDEISAKDMALVKEHFDHLRVRASMSKELLRLISIIVTESDILARFVMACKRLVAQMSYHEQVRYSLVFSCATWEACRIAFPSVYLSMFCMVCTFVLGTLSLKATRATENTVALFSPLSLAASVITSGCLTGRRV
jgi:hypothetical protein